MEKNIEKLKMLDKQEEQDEKNVKECRMCKKDIDESLTGFCLECGKKILTEKNEDIATIERNIERIKNRRDEKSVMKRVRWEEELQMKIDGANNLLDIIKKENK